MALARGLTALVLLAPLLAASCAPPRVGAESVALTFACQSHEVLHYRSLAEVFQAEHPGIVVRLASMEEITTHLGEGPDEEIGTAARAVDAFEATSPDERAVLEGVLLDLAPYARREGIYPGAELFAGAAHPFVRGDRLYGLPHQVHAYVLYYDPAAFERAGLPYPRPGWTREELQHAAVATTQRAAGETRSFGLVDRWPGYTVAALAGARAGTGEDLALVVDPVELADALMWYADLVRVHGAAPDPSAADAAQAAETLLMGEQPPAMWTGHSFEAGRFRRRYGAEVAPLPLGTTSAAPITVSGYVVSAQTQHPEAAWRWIEFLSRQPSATYYGGIMARRSAAYWQDLDASTAASFQYCLEHGAEYGPEVWTSVQRALVGVLRGVPLGEAMRDGPWGASAGAAQETPAPPSGRNAPVALARAVLAEGPLAETPPVTATIRFGVRSDQQVAVYRLLADRLALEQRGIAVEVVGPGAAADCFMAGAEVARRQPESTLVPLDGFIPAVRLQRAYPRILLDPVRGQGHVWALPLEADTRVLVYRRDRFDAAGLSYPSAGWTAESVVEHAALLTEVTADPPRYGYWPRGGAAFGAGQMIAWLGGSLLDEKGWPTLDSPTAVAALRRYERLIASAPPEETLTEVQALPWGWYPAPVETGQVALWLDDYGGARHAASRHPALGIAPLPRGAVTPSPRLEGALYISARAADPEACWQWLWYLGGRAEAVSLLPARLEVAWGDAWSHRAGDEATQAWRTTLSRLEEGEAWGPYSDGTTLRWADGAFAEVLQGADPADALARAQAKAQAYAQCMAPEGASRSDWEGCVRVAEGEASATVGE